MPLTIPSLPVEALAIARRLQEGLSPDCIYLFGSHARGNAGPDSDMDFLVVVPRSMKSRYDRAVEARRLVRDVVVPKDVIVLTRAEWERELKAPSSLSIRFSAKASLCTMSPESLDLARIWLSKSHSDLSTARLLIAGEEKHLDTGSYHCQQAAEKALKAWLTAREVIFPKTHSLEDLVALCIPSAPDFGQLEQHAAELTPLATAFRYPGDNFEPDFALASRALALAEEVYIFCHQQIGSQQK